MPKPNVVPLESARLRLRAIAEDDLPTTLAWRNRDEIRKWFVFSGVISWEGHLNWFRDYLGRDDDLLFVIETAVPVGQVALYRIDREKGEAEFGRLMLGESAGVGLAQEATSRLLAFAFEELGLTRVYLEVFAENERAIRLYERSGFRRTAEDGGMIRMEIVGTA